MRYAISDIHGCNRSFLALLDQIGLNKTDELFLLGDYIDRGPDSQAVLDTIFKLQADGFRLRCLRGNHEVMFSNCRFSYEYFSDWLAWGGQQTLQSFGVKHPGDVPGHYFDFIESLEYFFDLGENILVHAGLDFTNPLGPLADPPALSWQRGWEPDIDYAWLAGRKIIYGHTPLPRAEIELRFENLPEKQHLDIDGGCAYAQWNPSRGLGYLVAYELDTPRLIFQKSIENQ